MTNRTVLFHVGLPRAASTFLQRSVFPALDAAFLDIRVHPRSDATSVVHRGSTTFLRCTDEARAAIRAAGQDVIVSSDGFLLGNTSERLFDFEERAKRLLDIWPSARILIVLRRQDDFCRSLYVTALKKAYPYPPARLLGLREREGPEVGRYFPHTILRLNEIVATYERLFGAENVLTLPYEMLREDPSQFIQDIVRFGNYRLDAEVSPATVNRGLSRSGYAVARILNWSCFANRQSGQDALAWLESRSAASEYWRSVQRALAATIAAQHRTIHRIIMQANRFSRQAPHPLTSGERKQIMDYHAAGNRALSERRKLTLERYGYF
jgi:hypothetical protein